MITTDYILGVDGGNTKTIALISTPDGRVVGVGRGGCSDIYTNPDHDVPLSEVDAAVSSALLMAGIQSGDLAVGVFSMAGADWPEDFGLLRSEMLKRGYGREITIVHDAVGALRAGSRDGPAVVVALGTGAATASRSTDGRIWHNSWWQEPHGAHHLGLKTLAAVYRAWLGIDPPTALTMSVLRHFGLESVEDVLHLFTARYGPRPSSERVSSMMRMLLDIADNGDPTARTIIQEHGKALGDYALAAARRVGIEGLPFSLVLAGGVLRHPSRLLPDALIARVQAGSPEAKPVYSAWEPVVGALFLAMEAAGLDVSASVLDRLRATLPESALFAT